MKPTAADFKKFHQGERDRFLFFLCDKWKRKPSEFEKDLDSFLFLDWGICLNKNPLWFHLFFSQNSVFSGEKKWENFNIFCEKRKDLTKAELPCLLPAEEFEALKKITPSMLIRLNDLRRPNDILVSSDILNAARLFSFLDQKYNSTHLSASLARAIVDDVSFERTTDKEVVDWFYSQHSAQMYSVGLKARMGLVEHFLVQKTLFENPPESVLSSFWKILRLRHEKDAIPLFLPVCQKVLTSAARELGARKSFTEKLMLLNASSAWPWLEPKTPPRKKM